jgi:hypothetical protein
MNGHIKKLFSVSMVLIIILGFVASVSAITTCMTIFGRKCASGGCRDFDYGAQCTLYCTDRRGNDVQISCD